MCVCVCAGEWVRQGHGGGGPRNLLAIFVAPINNAWSESSPRMPRHIWDFNTGRRANFKYELVESV